MDGVVAVYQPHYYPRLHYLARAQQADIFVIYDDVQFVRRSPHHRAPIEYHDKKWLTIPVRRTGVDTLLCEARIDMSSPWPETHLQTLVSKYGQAAEELTRFYERLCATVVDINYLREHAGEVSSLTTDSRGAELVDDCLQWDDEWRRRQRAVDHLRTNKNRIANRIRERKRADPDADIEELIAEADAVNERLSEAEAVCTDAQERRNRKLVELSNSLDFDGEVETLSMKRLWQLAGVEPDELMADVKLVDLTVPLLGELLRRFGVTSTVVRSSELSVERSDDASGYLARLTEYLGGDCYLSGGVGYQNYLEKEPFDERGIDVTVQDWTPTWEEGNVCALDVLFGSDEPARYVS